MIEMKRIKTTTSNQILNQKIDMIWEKVVQRKEEEEDDDDDNKEETLKIHLKTDFDRDRQTSIFRDLSRFLCII